MVRGHSFGDVLRADDENGDRNHIHIHIHHTTPVTATTPQP
jgi:hypothetical protein